jgi:hypothetical protein
METKNHQVNYIYQYLSIYVLKKLDRTHQSHFLLVLEMRDDIDIYLRPTQLDHDLKMFGPGPAVSGILWGLVQNGNSLLHVRCANQSLPATRIC